MPDFSISWQAKNAPCTFALQIIHIVFHKSHNKQIFDGQLNCFPISRKHSSANWERESEIEEKCK